MSCSFDKCLNWIIPWDAKIANLDVFNALSHFLFIFLNKNEKLNEHPPLSNSSLSGKDPCRWLADTNYPKIMHRSSWTSPKRNYQKTVRLTRLRWWSVVSAAPRSAPAVVAQRFVSPHIEGGLRWCKEAGALRTWHRKILYSWAKQPKPAATR